MSMFDSTSKALGAAINFRQLRQEVVSANIANAETPGYKARKMDFEDALHRAIDREGRAELHASHGDHFPIGQGAISRARADVYENPEGNVSNDGNTVNLEQELVSLAENSVMYNAAVELMKRKMATLKYAASDGGR